jgi:hypothetical protein
MITKRMVCGEIFQNNWIKQNGWKCDDNNYDNCNENQSDTRLRTSFRMLISHKASISLCSLCEGKNEHNLKVCSVNNPMINISCAI